MERFIVKLKTLALAATATVAIATAAQAREEVRIVGSSTVFPFATKVADEVKAKYGTSVVIESTGSGGGHKLFCPGVGADTPDITNSSRARKDGETKTCEENGVASTEFKIGFDGIVVAHANEAEDFNLPKAYIFLAFAKEVPTPASQDTDSCDIVANPYTTWSDIDDSLPNIKIEAYGPPPTSGTRDAFVELAMEGGAKKVKCMAAMRKADKKKFEGLAGTVREDGGWIDGGENDNAIVQTLTRTPTAVGIFGFSFLEENKDKIKAITVDGVQPNPDSIAEGEYPVSRSLYFYSKNNHIDGSVPNTPSKGICNYLNEWTTEAAFGPGGYLEKIGLIPLPQGQRLAARAKYETLCE